MPGSVGVGAAMMVGAMCLTSTAVAQQSSKPVSREEYQKVQKRINDLETNYQRQIEQLKAQLESLKSAPPVAAQPGEVDERITDLEDEMDDVRSLAERAQPGINNFVITGYGFTGYNNAEGSDSSFNVGFNPIFLYQLGERAFVHAELEFELANQGDVNVALEDATFGYIVNDHLTLRGGKFLTPLSTFKEQLHPAWINKLPNQPLFAGGARRLIPTSSIGFEGRGAFAIKNTKLTYSAYVSNGFSINTSGSKTGQLSFSNFEDLNNSKSVGGRIGFFPIPELEIAYAFNIGNVNGAGVNNLTAFVQDIAISYVNESDKIGGKLDVRGELIFSRVNDADFGSGVFDNTRSGGYAQIAYRPTMSSSFLKDFEGVIRYDFLDQPNGAPVSYDENRITLGLNYWLNPSAVFKVAYLIDNKNGAGTDDNALMVQLAIGF